MDETDAGSVAPGDQRYIVTYLHDHKTLRKGDVVVMREFRSENVLVRVADGSVHALADDIAQYVHLRLDPVPRGEVVAKLPKLKPEFEIREEPIGGTKHWMIYKYVFLTGWVFFERWNTPETAAVRLAELQEAANG